jgi:hypothetical protein
MFKNENWNVNKRNPTFLTEIAWLWNDPVLAFADIKLNLTKFFCDFFLMLMKRERKGKREREKGNRQRERRDIDR